MPETIYYDGHCGLCHGFVKFVLARDPGGKFHFAPLDKLPVAKRAGLPDSVVVDSATGVLTKSSAALYILQGLGGVWAVLASIGRAVPRSVRDFVYDRIAQIRYRIFGKRDDVCPVVPKELRGRFEM